ncbi:MAG TPA: ribose ABC transporter, partial [Candidatus Atribacteria bacterium]|nr:ribose ABC transporter [Candidatus Atribacteria bacterium]
MSTPPITQENTQESKKWLYLLGRNWTILFLLGEAIVFSWIGMGFFSIKNFQNILVASTTILLLAAGETFVIITGGIDLSVGFVMGLCCVISAKIMVAL